MNSSYIFLTVCLCFFLISSSNGDVQKPFTLDDFLNKTFTSIAWNGTWINDSHFYYQGSDKNYYLNNAEDNTQELFVPFKILKPFNDATLQISHDLSYALIKFNVSSVYRHSTLAEYAALEIETNKYVYIAQGQKLQFCQWHPRNNSLIYVLENNVYYIPEVENEVESIPLSTDGISGVIYNGVPDWVYEEEVLGSDLAIWMSPFSDSLVYAKFDDTNVPEFSYYKYGKPGSMLDQYPEHITIRYPKVNAMNPSFEIFVVDLKTRSKRSLNVIPNGGASKDYILFDITWKDANNIAITFTNRVQNERRLVNCGLNSVICQNIDIMKEPRGWVDAYPPHFIKNNTELVQVTKAGDFQALLLTDSMENSMQLTKGKKVITKILGHNSSNFIFFEGSLAGNHSQQHVYTVNADTDKETCLTCDFSTPEGNCLYAKGIFSKNFTYMTKICNGPGPTYIEIVNMKTGASKVFEDNYEIRNKLSQKSMPIIKDVMIDLKNGFKAAVRLLLPPNMSSNKKYPMLVNVYAGPSSNRISDAFSVGLESYLVTKKQYIYAFIDGRGSGRRGFKLMYEIYKNLGTVEIEDQISAAKQLIKTFPFIDRQRVGIWGWSYGGFATAWVLAKDNEHVFNSGVSVAPVTDFIYYDSVYTEKYMSLAKDNEIGYNNTDVTREAEKFRGKNFLLIHGNADDNVHYQQAMMLARSLELADVPFQQMSYPDENHSLKGVLKHLYHSLDKFWDDALGGPTEIDVDTHDEDGKSSGPIDVLVGHLNNSDLPKPTSMIFLILLIIFAILIDY